MTECFISDENCSLLNISTSDDFIQNIPNEQVDRLKFIAYGIICPVIIGLGILGNITNLVVLTRSNLKGITFVYLTWLAISDLMSLVFCITSLLRILNVEPRTYLAALYYAHIEMPLVNAFMASSVFLVVTLTVDRYFSVCRPMNFKQVHNTQRATKSIAVAYICAFLLYIPVCFQKRPISMHVNNRTEYVAFDNPIVAGHTAFRIYLVVKEGLVRLGPVVLLTILNTIIILTFRKSLIQRPDWLAISGVGSPPSRKRCKDKQRLCNLLTGIVILFVISMTPAAFLTILNREYKEFHFGFQLFRALANIIELSNYAMNFYVYCICNSEIRRNFVELVTCAKPNVNECSPSSRPSLVSNSKF
ncbi:probable G-protein coupled receptor AH9.1 [Nephila pilipes]|uniref:Probable G-protein coupled receptor AH9.1 n=1 Tax=Nephila pilipes TaxID=299642 RepID=A0A8X6PQL1_NEPPI|nr:probable G-protein coupled receptor AH9.1 [Nephila pilipes]